MNPTELNGNWILQKDKLLKKFATLTESDVTYAEGKKEEMMGKLQVKLGKTKDEVTKIIEAL